MSEQPVRAEERVFLVVVDESPEMRNALRYACRRAKRTGGRVAMLYVMDPPEAQQWGAVVDLMRQEARQQAEDVIAKHADVAVSLTGQPPTIHIREGKSRDELVKLITEDRSISVLVLASAATSFACRSPSCRARSPKRRSMQSREACAKLLRRFRRRRQGNSLCVP